MPVVGDGSLYEIIDNQLRGTTQFLNRYFYFSGHAPDSVAVSIVFDAWEDIFVGQLPLIQPDVVSHSTTIVNEVTSVSNFGEFTSNIPDGTLTLGDPLPNFCAAKFRLLRTTKETRSGFKRIMAGSEDVSTGNLWTAAFLSLLETVAPNFAVALDLFPIDAAPAIVRITRDGLGEILPPDEWIYNPVGAIGITNVITTQKTRQVGIGI